MKAQYEKIMGMTIEDALKKVENILSEPEILVETVESEICEKEPEVEDKTPQTENMDVSSWIYIWIYIQKLSISYLSLLNKVYVDVGKRKMILLQSFLSNRFLTTELVILEMVCEGDSSPSG